MFIKVERGGAHPPVQHSRSRRILLLPNGSSPKSRNYSCIIRPPGWNGDCEELLEGNGLVPRAWPDFVILSSSCGVHNGKELSRDDLALTTEQRFTHLTSRFPIQRDDQAHIQWLERLRS